MIFKKGQGRPPPLPPLVARLWVFIRSFSTEVPELISNFEEADTRLVLHTNPAYDSGIQNVLVVSEDEDVIALFLANVDLLNGQLFQISEIQNCQKSLDIKQLRNGISSNIAGLRLISDLKK